MAGKIANGVSTYFQTFKPAIAKAFCEGMYHRTQGTAVGYPISDNPYDGDGSEAEAAWDAGWNRANGQAGGTIDATDAEAASCALTGISVSA